VRYDELAPMLLNEMQQEHDQRNSNGQSVGWTIASIPFRTAPGIGWRLHMSKIAAKIRTVLPVRAPLC
jgi:hypothetical protein